MSTRAESTALYAALEQALGPDPARILMERLPEPTDLATKTDLLAFADSLRVELGSRFDAIDQRLDSFEARFEGIDAGFEKVDARFEGIEARFEKADAGFEKIDARFEKIDDRLHEFHETLRSYARTFVVAQTATVFGVAGIVLGITQLM